MNFWVFLIGFLCGLMIGVILGVIITLLTQVEKKNVYVDHHKLPFYKGE